MKKMIILLFVLFSAVFAQSELKYEVVKVNKVYTDPGSPKDTLLTYILEYPKFDESGKYAKTAKFLNEQVNSLYSDSDAKGKEDYEYFLAGYKEYANETEGVFPAIPWYIEKRVDYTSPADGVGTLTYSGYQYSGGAHGGSWVYYNNYDLKKQTKLVLSDVMVKNYQKTLLSVGEKLFRKLKGLSPGQGLEDEFWFENNKFHFNDNFLFTPEGLIFYYNEYEIACYACGTTELLIPWKEIKTLVQKNGLLGKFSK